MKNRLLDKNHWNWRGGVTRGKTKSEYSVSLRRKKHGFTEEIFTQKMKEQKGGCAICSVVLGDGLNERTASADHCHETKKPRGILCKRCNLMIGLAGDDGVILNKAIEYLEFWKRIE